MARRKKYDKSWWRHVSKDEFIFRLAYGSHFYEIEEYTFHDKAEMKKAFELHKVNFEMSEKYINNNNIF